MKKKYYLISLAVFIILLIISYHFYAASQAEGQIDKALSQLSEKQQSLSLQYSQINIKPFRADLDIQDFTAISGQNIIRFKSLAIDISYPDLLRLYIFGTENALSHLSPFSMTFTKPSYNSSKSLGEVKSDTMQVTYSGDLLSGLQSLQTNSITSARHNITIDTENFVAVLPDSNHLSVKAEQLKYQFSLLPEQEMSLLKASHQLSVQKVIWSPTQSMQQQYSFIIKGLGYATDSIPFKSFNITAKPAEEAGLFAVDCRLRSELAQVSGSGHIKKYQPIGSSEFKDTKIMISDLSPSFQKTLKSIEQLFSFTLPRTKKGLALQLRGTIARPSISLSKKKAPQR